MAAPTLVRVSTTSAVNAGLLASRLVFGTGSTWYAILIEKSASRKLTAHKSTDGGFTWNEVAAGTGPVYGDSFWENIDGVQVGTKIWISFASEIGLGGPALKVVAFDTATDTFAAPSSVGPTLYAQTIELDDGGSYRSFISYRASDDTLHMVYLDAPEDIGGPDYGRVGYIDYAIGSGVWGSPTNAFGTGETQTYYPAGIVVVPASGRVHTFANNYDFTGATWISTEIWTRCRNLDGTWNAKVLATDQAQVIQEPPSSMPLYTNGNLWIAFKAQPPTIANFDVSIKAVAAPDAATTTWTPHTVNLETANGSADGIQPPEVIELTPTRTMVLWQEGGSVHGGDLRRIRYRVWNGTVWESVGLLIDTGTINPSYSPENFHGRKIGNRLALMAPVLFSSTFDSWVLAVDAPASGNFAVVS